MNTIKNQIAAGVNPPTAKQIATAYKRTDADCSEGSALRLAREWRNFRKDLTMHFHYQYAGYFSYWEEAEAYLQNNPLPEDEVLVSVQGHCFHLPKAIAGFRRYHIWCDRHPPCTGPAIFSDPAFPLLTANIAKVSSEF